MIVGCSSGDRLPVVPVSGSVVLEGEPVEGAMLVFHPRESRDAGVLSYAESTADGTFQASTYDAYDGIPEGDYAVTLTWPEIDEIDGGFGPDRLKGKFNAPESTPFRATVAGPSMTLEPFDVSP